MKPLLSTRLRFALLLCGVVGLTLAAIWGVRRWEALRILDRTSAEVDLDSNWESPWKSEETTWWRLLPNAHITYVQVNGIESRGEGLGWAVRVCGRLERVEIRSGAKREVMGFLRGLGWQPTVRDLQINASHSLDAVADRGRDDLEVGLLLRQFPNLQELSVSGLGYSSENFPALRALASLSLDNMPISDAGFATILRCPALRVLAIGKGAETTAVAAVQVPEHRTKALRTLYLHLTGLRTPGESTAIEEWLSAVCPDLECHIDGPVPAHEELVDPRE